MVEYKWGNELLVDTGDDPVLVETEDDPVSDVSDEFDLEQQEMQDEENATTNAEGKTQGDGSKEEVGEYYTDSEEFEDDSSDSMSSAEAREAAIRDGFLGFLQSQIQNDIFQRFLEYVHKIINWILKKIGRFQEEEDNDAADEIAQELMEDGMDDIANSGKQALSAGQPSGGPSGSGGGGGNGGAPPGTAEMATAAANSAAAGAAAGSVAAGAAGAGALAGAATVAAGTSAAAQVGVAIGVAAAVGAVSSGIAQVPATSASKEFTSNFTPPICSDASVKKLGFVEFRIQALPQEALIDKKWILEELFRDVYNEISGTILLLLYRFRDNTSFGGSGLENWDVSNVTTMSSMFDVLNMSGNLNADLSSWDVSKVKNFFAMFQFQVNFNSDLSGWNVANATTLEKLFRRCDVFNSDVSSWQVQKVTNFSRIFVNALAFNQDLCSWGNIITNTAANVDYFVFGTPCPITTKPNLLASPKGPFCYDCPFVP